MAAIGQKQTSMTLSSLFVLSLVTWVLIGVAWLFPKKLKLMKRLGHLTADEIIQLGKAGDIEVQNLRKRTWWWIGMGLAVLLPQQIVLSVVKTVGS
jgi:hypothetical protein